MIELYSKNKKQLSLADCEKSALILVTSATKADEKQICKSINIDDYIFEKHNSAAEVSHLQSIEDCRFKNAKLLITLDLQNKYDTIEADLTPVIAIFNEEKLVLISTSKLTALKEELKSLNSFSPINILVNCILLQNQNFSKRLKLIKKEIDDLDKNARQTTKTKELKRVTDLTRELVYLEHTVDDQSPTIKQLSDYLLKNNLISNKLASKLQTSQLRLKKTIKIYTDLLASISSLFSAMMDSHLNHLMKYLDSVALLISIPALISGIWGMNVGGLPGKDQDFGFLGVMLFSVIIVIISGIILSRKKYLDD